MWNSPSEDGLFSVLKRADESAHGHEKEGQHSQQLVAGAVEAVDDMAHQTEDLQCIEHAADDQ